MDDLEREFRALIDSQGELVGSITHDLKGMISGVEGGLYLIDSGVKKDKKERLNQGVEMLKRNTNRIRRVVANVLYYIKDRDNSWQPIDTEGLMASVEKALKEHGVDLGVGLKVVPESSSFEGEESAVFSLLVNLVEYAFYGCNLVKGKPSPLVTLSALSTDECMVFDILADGFSIEDETIQMALGRYYTPKGVDRSHLTLFIAHKLVGGHHGTLTITPSLSQGTTRFLVELPKTKPAGLRSESDDPIQSNLAKEWDTRD